jgi:hypothetical protein
MSLQNAKKSKGFFCNIYYEQNIYSWSLQTLLHESKVQLILAQTSWEELFSKSVQIPRELKM